MTRTAWRIVSHAYADVAFSGEGARLFGGRWNAAGTPLIYTAGSLSLAALEQLVHLGHSALMDHQFVFFSATFPAAAIRTLDTGLLPAGWQHDLEKTRRMGTRWAEALDSLVLAVPSAVIETEVNYLINPRHPEMNQVAIGPRKPFAFDPRFGA